MKVIKESFDNLPAVVCIFNDKGLVRLMNHRMLMVGAMFFGSGVQTLGELQAALKQPPAGVTADLAMPGVYHFPLFLPPGYVYGFQILYNPLQYDFDFVHPLTSCG